MNDLLEDIRSKGLSVTVNNGQILITPKHLISDDIRSQIKANKAGLIKAITTSELVEGLIFKACAGLSITPEQLRMELVKGSEMPDIVDGLISSECLRLTAYTLSLLRGLTDGRITV